MTAAAPAALSSRASLRVEGSRILNIQRLSRCSSGKDRGPSTRATLAQDDRRGSFSIDSQTLQDDQTTPRLGESQCPNHPNYPAPRLPEGRHPSPPHHLT